MVCHKFKQIDIICLVGELYAIAQITRRESKKAHVICSQTNRNEKSRNKRLEPRALYCGSFWLIVCLEPLASFVFHPFRIVKSHELHTNHQSIAVSATICKFNWLYSWKPKKKRRIRICFQGLLLAFYVAHYERLHKRSFCKWHHHHHYHKWSAFSIHFILFLFIICLHCHR